MTTAQILPNTTKRKRESLAHLTIDERRDRRRAQVSAAAQRSAERKREARLKMESLPVATLDAEMTKWINGVLAKPLDVAALEVAIWERDHEMQVPNLKQPVLNEARYNRKYERWDRWNRVQSMKHNAIDREHQKVLRVAREARQKQAEIRKAEELGVTLQEYRDAGPARAFASWEKRMKSRNDHDGATAGVN